MSPRPYRLGQREKSTEQTRARILTATRELLLTGEGLTGFSIDAVARRADVARMTVYHQFGSKIGLLEALSDNLAAHGGMEQLANAFRRTDPFGALDEFVRVFSQFWQSDRIVTRRLRAMSALDPDFEKVVKARDERRREGLRVITSRIADKCGKPSLAEIDDTVNILFTLLSFETFDTLAGYTRTIEEVVSLVQRLARAAIGVAKEN